MRKMTTPVASMPRRPARPDIWIYSPEDTRRNSSPSNLRALANATVRAGMLRPMAKVSVANRILRRPSWKRISTTSLMSGSRPPWWMPMPRLRMGSTLRTCGRALSSSESASTALRKISSTEAFSSSVVRSKRSRPMARDSQSFLERAKTIMGNSLYSLAIRAMLDTSWSALDCSGRGALPPLPARALAFSLLAAGLASAVARSSATALSKLDWRKGFSPSLTQYMPLPPSGNT
mmetsp:Transcript_2566/g.8474  ORF Transcript_2566/g.8474 Transcript_2566/m.8474 type:complete len:234 (+) Transcript_2566:192-893(+)